MFERYWSAAWLLCSLTSLTVSATLQIQQVIVPAQVMSGSNAILRCLYGESDSPDSSDHQDPLSGPLYSLKWYKGSHEFYRHLPRENPPTTVFHWSQFNIEADDSEPGRVILRGVTPEAEGSYKCEVSAEGTFHTDFAESNLTVIDVQHEALTMIQDPVKDEAKVGERLGWNCTFGQSRPAAHITWLVNGELVSPRYTSLSNGESNRDSKHFQSVDSYLQLTLAERHFKNQWLRVACVVSIGAAFKKTKELLVRQYSDGRSAQHNPSAVVGPNGNRMSSSNAGGDFQPSMAKIAGSQRGNNSGSGASSTWSGWIASGFVLLQATATARVANSF